jgi:crossover junction endodeoxyribonuclease RuvC
LAELIRILGIDPGSRITGYGIVDSNGKDTRYVVSGCIRIGATDFGARLEEIYAGVRELIEEFTPRQVAIEKVFVHRNADSALKLGQARAAAICGTFGGRLELFEYAARQVKQAVVGRGGADKEQVQHMVKAILSLRGTPGPDEADALAVAICHAHSRPIKGSLDSSGVSARRSLPSSWRKLTG